MGGITVRVPTDKCRSQSVSSQLVTYSDRINSKGPGKGIQDMIEGKVRQLMQYSNHILPGQ